MSYTLGILGAGNMAEGIVAAAVRAGVLQPGQLIVSDPLEGRRELFRQRFGVAATADNRAVVGQSQAVLLAVKPQNFLEVSAGVKDLVRREHLVISIMAGVSTARIAATLGPSGPRVVRVMPNLPIVVGAGMAGLYAAPQVPPEDVAWVRRLFDAGGATVELKDESLMDAVTAISGSGPAYFYAFVEAMVEGGKACGLAEADALTLAEHACLGAARMMIETGEPPAELRRKVTSRGGTTQAALETLTAAGVDRAIAAAVVAAFRRGRELGA